MAICKDCADRDSCETYQNNLKETGRVLFGCSKYEQNCVLCEHFGACEGCEKNEED
jgi:hypothetical protein